MKQAEIQIAVTLLKDKFNLVIFKVIHLLNFLYMYLKQDL